MKLLHPIHSFLLVIAMLPFQYHTNANPLPLDTESTGCDGKSDLCSPADPKLHFKSTCRHDEMTGSENCLSWSQLKTLIKSSGDQMSMVSLAEDFDTLFDLGGDDGVSAREAVLQYVRLQSRNVVGILDGGQLRSTARSPEDNGDIVARTEVLDGENDDQYLTDGTRQFVDNMEEHEVNLLSLNTDNGADMDVDTNNDIDTITITHTNSHTSSASPIPPATFNTTATTDTPTAKPCQANKTNSDPTAKCHAGVGEFPRPLAVPPCDCEMMPAACCYCC